MKRLILALSLMALGLMIFNTTKLDFSNPFEGDSLTAVLAIIAGCCAILLLQILRISKKIDALDKKQK